MQLRGAVHVHSRYSDGEYTLAELREVFLRLGCGFVCVTDHAEAFDAASLHDYLAECEALSDQCFRFVPGLEYSCRERMHVLGYGSVRLINAEDPEAVIRTIQEGGSIAVIAHPADAAFRRIETFSVLPDGIEVWNSKYDGRYAPRPATFDLLHGLRARKPDLKAFYGLDLHWKKQFRELFTIATDAELESQSILGALSAGRFVGVKGELKLPANGELPEIQLKRFEAQHGRSERFRQWLRTGKEILDRFGIQFPSAIKSQLRRIF